MKLSTLTAALIAAVSSTALLVPSAQAASSTSTVSATKFSSQNHVLKATPSTIADRDSDGDGDGDGDGNDGDGNDIGDNS